MGVTASNSRTRLAQALSRARPRILVVLGAAVYFALFNWAYATAMSPWRYIGYTYNPPQPGFVVFSWIVAIIPSLWMPTSLRRPSQVGYWLLYVVVFVPSALVPFYTLEMGPIYVATLVLALLAAFALLGSIYLLPVLRIPRFRIPPALFWTGILLLSLLLYAQIVSAYGLRINVVSLADIYELRTEYKAARGGFVGYAVGWQANAVNPLLIAQGLVSGNVLLLLAGILGQVVIFSITGYKSVFFSGLLLVALLFVLRSKGKRLGASMVWGTAGLVLVSSLLQLWLNSGVLFSVFVRRLIATPGLLTGYYLEFFSQNPKALLGHSIFRSLVDYAYEFPPAIQIGSTYLGDPAISANANLWADAFANFGYGGIFAFTILLGLVMWLFDSVAQGRSMRLTALLFGMPAFFLTNTALLTSLLTHGIGLVLVIVYLMPRKAAPAEAPERIPAQAPG